MNTQNFTGCKVQEEDYDLVIDEEANLVSIDFNKDYQDHLDFLVKLRENKKAKLKLRRVKK